MTTIDRRTALRGAGGALGGLLLLGLPGSLGCEAEPPEGTTPQGGTKAPEAIKLTDTTAVAFLTWMDKQGRTHTELTINEVPAEGRDLVRVLTVENTNRHFFHIADLRTKKPDGSYGVTVMPAKKWESLIKERREAYRATMAPKPQPPSGAGAQAGVDTAIVYGASWCKPCHQAEHFLKSKGVDVVMYDIEKEPQRRREMKEKLSKAGRRSHSIPVIDVAGTILVGFNPTSLNRVLKEAGRGGTNL